MKKINFLFTCLLTLLVASSANATNYYVSSILGTAGNPGTLAQPFVALQAAANVTNPGDTVYVMNGTYQSVNSGTNQSIVTITRSGTNGNYITYRAYPGHTPKIKLVSGLSYQIWRAVAINASYIIFDGIEIEGANGSLDYAGAYQTYQDYKNNIKDFNKISSYNCNAISVGVFGVATAHHVIVQNCKVHDAGGGIGATNCDYLTIENNIIYGTCWYSMYAGSGISILNPVSIDAITTYKMFVRNNTVYSNKTLIPWINIDALSDGNGIILDVNTGAIVNSVAVPAYVGRYLVTNNVSYNNGGGGVHAYKAAHVDIINNTAYNNGTVVGYPEIDANQCSDVVIYNNIMYGRGTGTNCNGNDANTIYDYNVYFNGSSYKNGSHDMTADPKFVAKALDATANFQLLNSSPAINNGSNTAGQFATTDILGVTRPVGFSSDMGAYEYPTVIPRTEIGLFQGTTEITSGGTSSFDFGDVASTTPKTITFTIQNTGDQILNLTGTPRVVVTGAGFSLAADAPTTVAAGGSATFDVLLTTSTTAGNYNGTISIANNDANENPYTFALTGYGYDGAKTLQTITFPALPIKVIGNADFDAGATSSAGLPITYTSSTTGVATIVSGKIHINTSVGGTSTITAAQAGDGATNPAKSITQVLTVTPVLPAAGTNMVSNPTFDVNTAGWSFAYNAGGAATVTSTPMSGSATNVGQVVVTNPGSPATQPQNIQLGTNVFLVKDKNYLISFKANGDANRAISLKILLNASPFTTIYTKNINITTTQTTYGTYSYTSTYTGSVALRFWVGNTTAGATTYFDDVSMVEEPTVTTLPIELLLFNGSLLAGKSVLNWQTATELNAKEFIVEKGLDGTTFSQIGKVIATNNANGSNYDFTDNNTKDVAMFYRLKLVDKDGSFRYSNVVFIKGGLLISTGIKIFPNPVTSYFTIAYPIAAANASLSILSDDGKKIGEYHLAAGSAQRSIDVSRFAHGHYVVVYKNNNQTISGSFIK